MKILIVNMYSKKNNGDAAILSVLIEQLQKAFPKALLQISILEKDNETTFENIPLVNAFLSFVISENKSIIKKYSKIFYYFCISIFWSYIVRSTSRKIDRVLPSQLKELLHVFNASDLVVAVGGGYLRGKNNVEESINLLYLLLPLIVGKILRKKVILHAQSIGAFGNIFQEKSVGFILKYMDLILVREDYSLKKTLKMDIQKSKIIRTGDAAFLFSAGHVDEVSIKKAIERKANKVLGLTVRKWLDGKRQHQYEKAIAAFVTYVVREKKMDVVFIPQVTTSVYGDDDTKAAADIIQILPNDVHVTNVIQPYSHHELKALYSQLDFLVGTRLHSVIFSITSGIPAIAIQYEYKTGGILKDLLLSDWVIKIEDITVEILIEKFNALINNEKEYKKNLQIVIPEYINNVSKMVDIFQSSYYENHT